MAQTPVTGIRLSDAMESRFAKAVSRSHHTRADLHRALLNIALHVLEAESYDIDRALLRAMIGRPAAEIIPPLEAVEDFGEKQSQPGPRSKRA